MQSQTSFIILNYVEPDTLLKRV